MLEMPLYAQTRRRREQWMVWPKIPLATACAGWLALLAVQSGQILEVYRRAVENKLKGSGTVSE